jgi:hypothetical protein
MVSPELTDGSSGCKTCAAQLRRYGAIEVIRSNIVIRIYRIIHY